MSLSSPIKAQCMVTYIFSKDWIRRGEMPSMPDLYIYKAVGEKRCVERIQERNACKLNPLLSPSMAVVHGSSGTENSPTIIDLILVPIGDPTVYCHYFEMDHTGIYITMVAEVSSSSSSSSSTTFFLFLNIFST